MGTGFVCEGVDEMIFENGFWNLKEVCIMFRATHIIKDGVSYSSFHPSGTK